MAWYNIIRAQLINTLALGRCCSNFKSVNFKHMLQIKFVITSNETVLKKHIW